MVFALHTSAVLPFHACGFASDRALQPPHEHACCRHALLLTGLPDRRRACICRSGADGCGSVRREDDRAFGCVISICSSGDDTKVRGGRGGRAERRERGQDRACSSSPAREPRFAESAAGHEQQSGDGMAGLSGAGRA